MPPTEVSSCVGDATVEKQEVGCEHLVVGEMPIGILLLDELCDGILAVGLDDGVGEAMLHDKAFEMLSLMLCWL